MASHSVIVKPIPKNMLTFQLSDYFVMLFEVHSILLVSMELIVLMSVVILYLTFVRINMLGSYVHYNP